MIGDVVRYSTVIASLVGVFMLAMTMSSHWSHLARSAQQLRYWSLLFYAMSTTYGVCEGIIEEVPFGFRHVVSLAATIFMLVAVIYTYRDARRDARED